MTTHRSSRTLNCCMRLEKAHPFQQQVILCRCRSHELARFTLLTARALFGHQLWTQLVRSTAPGEARTKAELKTNGTSFAPPILTNNFEPYLISRECAARLSHGDSTATSVSGRGDRFAVNGKLKWRPSFGRRAWECVIMCHRTNLVLADAPHISPVCAEAIRNTRRSPRISLPIDISIFALKKVQLLSGKAPRRNNSSAQPKLNDVMWSFCVGQNVYVSALALR